MPILGKFSISKSALKSYCPKLAEGYPRALLKRAYVDQILVMLHSGYYKSGDSNSGKCTRIIENSIYTMSNGR